MKTEETMKRIILSIFALVAAGVATAQEEDYSRWSVTPKAGLTVATVVGDDAQENSSSTAWAAGLEASLRPSRLLSFDFGLFYTRDRVKERGREIYKDEIFDLTVSHFHMVAERIDIPLMLGLHVLPGLTLKAGVQPSLLLSALVKGRVTGTVADMEQLTGSIFSVEDVAKLPRKPYNDDISRGFKSQMNNFDVCIPVGASYEWRNIVLDARYNFGQTNITKKNLDQDVHRRYLLLTLGYRFSL